MREIPEGILAEIRKENWGRNTEGILVGIPGECHGGITEEILARKPQIITAEVFRRISGGFSCKNEGWIHLKNPCNISLSNL